MPAAHYRYKSGGLSITPAGESELNPNSVTTCNFSQGGQTTDLMSDASELVQELPLSSIKGALSISLLDQIGGAGIPLGAAVITITVERVKSGRGAVAAADKLITFTNAVIVSVDADVGQQAGGGSNLSIEVADDGSGNIYVISDPA